MNALTDSIAPMMAAPAELRPATEGELSIDDCRMANGERIGTKAHRHEAENGNPEAAEGRRANIAKHPNRSSSSPQRAETGKKQRPRASKRGIRRRLPGVVRRELDKEILSVSEVTVAWLARLDEKFRLRLKYGVTASGLRGLVFRMRAKHGEEVKSLHDRQEWVGKVLKELLGEKGKDNPHLLGQHA